jgi:hypothetical protein
MSLITISLTHFVILRKKLCRGFYTESPAAARSVCYFTFGCQVNAVLVQFFKTAACYQKRLTRRTNCCTIFHPLLGILGIYTERSSSAQQARHNAATARQKGFKAVCRRQNVYGFRQPYVGIQPPKTINKR